MRCQGAFPVQEMGSRLKSFSRAGVVRAIAKSDHWRQGWPSRWACTSWNAVSICLRRRQMERMVRRGRVGIGAQQGLGFSAAGRVPQEHPAQRNGGLAGVVPEGRARSQIQMLLRPVGPEPGQRGPARGRGLQTVL